MHRLAKGLAFCITAFALSAAAQTVTGSGTANTVPMFTGTSTVGNSVITQSTTGDVTINGSSGLRTTFQVTGSDTIGTEMDLSNSDTGGKSWGWVSNGNAYPTYFPETSGCLSLHEVTDGSYPAEFCQTFITLFQNVGIGTSTSPAYTLDVAGTIRATTGYVFPDGSTQVTAFIPANCGADYAESVGVTGDRTKYEPGDILVIDPDNAGKFLKSNQAYSTMVAGIYSTKPGFVGRLEPATAETKATEVPMAMVGRVPTKVSAENGPIKVGDLLVASSTLGYAMKGTDRSQMLGAVIGKALGPLDSGTGVIEVLVTLQ